jgi:hypothetical protein
MELRDVAIKGMYNNGLRNQDASQHSITDHLEILISDAKARSCPGKPLYSRKSASEHDLHGEAYCKPSRDERR